MTTKSDPLRGKRWHTLQGLRPHTATAIENGQPVFFATTQVIDRNNGLQTGDVISAWLEPCPHDWIVERLTPEQRADLWILDDPDLTPAQRRDRDYFRGGGATRFYTLKEASGVPESLDDLKRKLAEALESQRHSDDLASWAGARASGDMLNESEGADRPRRVLISKIDYSKRIGDLRARIAKLETERV
jgi:hypothetical protein